MITASGITIDGIASGGSRVPTPNDIAVHAGRICRFGGAVWSPLLPHLAMVGLMSWNRTKSPEQRVANLVWGFLHDAHEVLTSDVPRPFKCECMRLEQASINGRLLDVYLGAIQHKVDFDLIKRVDLDAADIEGMQLQIPNFREYARSHSLEYRGEQIGEPYTSDRDVRLFWAIRSSPLFIGCTEPGTGTAMFVNMLVLAKARCWRELVEFIKGWNLL